MTELIEITHKTCSICLVEKPLEEFGHHKNMIAGRYSSCKECTKEKSKLNYQKHKEKINKSNIKNYYDNREHYLEQSKKRYEENPQPIIDRAIEWAKENKPKAKSNWRSSALRRKYGISLEQYQKLLDAQDGKCAICERPADSQKGNFHVDHAHTESKYVPAGMIRGLLCWTCNLKIIGKNTNPLIFEKAASYLKQHTGWMVPSDQIKPKRKRRRKNR